MAYRLVQLTLEDMWHGRNMAIELRRVLRATTFSPPVGPVRIVVRSTKHYRMTNRSGSREYGKISLKG